MKDRLKEMRKALHLKQRDVAERLGISVGNLGSWESGRERVPPARVYQICKEYNVRREWLETGEPPMIEPGKTASDALREAALSLFNELSEEGQDAVIAAIDEYLEKSGKKSKRKGPRVQTNNGTVHGDMVQN